MNLVSAIAIGLLLLAGQFTIPQRSGAIATTTPPLNPCLISGWPINEGTGTTLHDVSANANTATIGGPAHAIWGTNAGFPGSSLSISTFPSIITTTNSLTNFDGTAPFSSAAWINIPTVASNQIIISTLTTGSYTGWEMGAGTFTADKLHFIISNAIGSNAIEVFGSIAVEATGKHYVVATYDGSRSTSGVHLYVDGTADTVNIQENNLTASSSSSAQILLGERPQDLNTMTGVLSSVAVYNCVLTSTQVSTYFALGPRVN